MGKYANKFKRRVYAQWADYKLLLQECPTITLVAFVLSIVLMNLFANKQLLNIKYLALDCGFLVSWISFLCMDMLTQHFGAKPAVKISIFANSCNLICCGVFYMMAHVGSEWSVYYTYADPIVNAAIDATFSGSWYILAGSTIASITSSAVNAFVNVSVGYMCDCIHIRSNAQYILRSSISTAAGQLIDNLVFATLVSKVFFGWTWTQVIMCSITGGLFELIAEMLFSPIGCIVCKKWKNSAVGQNYLNTTKHELNHIQPSM